MFTQMTDKQIAMFSRKLAELPELSHFATGEAGRSYEAFAELIASELNNSVKKIKYMPYLEKVGLRGCRGLPMPKMVVLSATRNFALMGFGVVAYGS